MWIVAMDIYHIRNKTQEIKNIIRNLKIINLLHVNLSTISMKSDHFSKQKKSY